MLSLILFSCFKPMCEFRYSLIILSLEFSFGLLPADLKELEMHSFDLNLLCCLQFAKPRLPAELREKIFHLSNEVRKKWRQKEQMPPFCGTSKSAMKRRAKRYEKCIGCGNWSHTGRCRRSQTESQHEYTLLMRVGAIRLDAERSIRVGSNVHYRIKEDLIHILDKTGLDDLTLKESLGL